MEWERLDEIRSLLEAGDSTSAVAGLLDRVAELMEQVDTLNVQMEALLDALDEGEDRDFADYMEDECSYIVTCSNCGCLLEVESGLLEDEDAELSCPQCSAILEI